MLVYLNLCSLISLMDKTNKTDETLHTACRLSCNQGTYTHKYVMQVDKFKQSIRAICPHTYKKKKIAQLGKCKHIYDNHVYMYIHKHTHLWF